MKIRHLVLTDSFAGAEQHVCVLANQQSRNGHHVEVWGGEPASMRARLDGNVAHRACPSVLSAVKGAVGSDRRMDILHAHMTKGEVAALLTAVMGKTPVVSTRHFAAVRGRSVAGRLARPVLRANITAQIAVSEYVAARIDGPSRVIYAGVEQEVPVDQARDQVILVAQRLSPEKRTADALVAFGESGLAERGWRLDVAGRGRDMDAIERRAARMGLSQAVRLLGFCDDLQDRLATASIVLATAPSEPFGLTVVEAMAHGTPVVAAASGGHLESVGRAGPEFLYDVGDVGSAGALLAELAADEQLRNTYGTRLRHVQGEHFTTDRQYRDTQAIYEGVVRG